MYLREWNKPSYSKQKLGGCEKCQQKILWLDLYKQPFRLLLPDGSDQYKSFLGSLLSILTVMTLLSYATYKFSSLVSYSDYKVQVSNEENFYNADDKFGFPDGYMISAGLVTYDGKSDRVEDPSIAQLKFYAKVYNSSDPSVSFGFREIPTRYCDPADFNQNGTNVDSLFYKTSQVSLSDIKVYGPRLKCPVDPNDVNVQGNFDSAAASNFMVVLEKCENATSSV
mmetsp:Transcript_3956/g.4738  ORF Transcript_3956/g.4738 Transcript_3956/m.4738 type:complete len:225 (-) Transcript_3956:1540-2214(-)